MNFVELRLRRVFEVQAVFMTLVCCFGCASSSQSLGSAVVPQGVNLTGTWVFNEEESDDTRELMPMMQGPQGGEAGMPGDSVGGRRPGGGGGMPPGGGGMSPGGGMMGGREGGGMPPGGRGGAPQGSRMDPEKMRQTMQLAMDPKRRFSIEQSDSTVEIATVWREPFVIRFDGKELKRKYDWGELKVKAGWLGRGLVVEWDVDGGGKVRERYSLSTTTDQLFVVTRVELERGPVEFRRVYDPAEEPSPDV